MLIKFEIKKLTTSENDVIMIYEVLSFSCHVLSDFSRFSNFLVGSKVVFAMLTWVTICVCQTRYRRSDRGRAGSGRGTTTTY